MEFYPLRIRLIEQNTPTCKLVTFDVPLELQDLFSYQSGQYLTMKMNMDGEDIIRHYSLCSCNQDREWRVGIKLIEHGKFSSKAHSDWVSGDVVNVSPPTGNFVMPNVSDQQTSYVAYVAGSGITPVFSIISDTLRNNPRATFKLFYVNRTSSLIILKEELEALKNNYLDRFEIFYFLTAESRSVPLLNGRINPEKLDLIFKVIADINAIDHHFICGPEAMLKMIQDYLVDHRITKDRIHFELFHAEGASPQQVEQIARKYHDQTSDITLIEGGKTFNYSLPKGSNTILDSALEHAADLPFACKGGVCCTCKAKLLEGKVEMPVHYGLEDDEIENGYILTCQAIPVSEKILVDYDA